MNNPAILNPINTKLNISNVQSSSGIKVFQVNPNPITEIHTGSARSGDTFSIPSGYVVADSFKPVYGTNFIPFYGKWSIYTSGTGLVRVITITGVDDSNNEITEDINTTGTGSNISILTNKSYKMINEISLKSGGPIPSSGWINIINAYVTTETGYAISLLITDNYKTNPVFMCSNKNGIKRNARLRSINSLYITQPNTDLILHIFKNNTTVPNTAFTLYNINTTQGITFPEDGIVELEPGDYAIFYHKTTGRLSYYMGFNFTWSYYYTS